MLISSSKQTVSCVKHIIDVASFFISYTDLQLSFDINYPCKFHVTPEEKKTQNYHFTVTKEEVNCLSISRAEKLLFSDTKNTCKRIFVHTYDQNCCWFQDNGSHEKSNQTCPHLFLFFCLPQSGKQQLEIINKSYCCRFNKYLP